MQLILPPAPTSQENFGDIDALKNIALVIDGDPERGEPAKKRRAFVSISYDAASRTPALEKPVWSSGPLTGVTNDMAAWEKWFRATGILTMPPDSGNPAANVLAAIDSSVPVIKELAASTGRPSSQFTPVPAERNWSGLLVAHPTPFFSDVQNAVNLLRLRAVAAAHANDGKAATESLIAMSRLAEAAGHEPFLIGHLVSITLTSIMHTALWEGLKLRVFSADELQELTECLLRYHGRELLLYASRTEMLAGLNAVEQLKANRNQAIPIRASSSVSAIPHVGSFLPSGWFDQNASKLVSLEWEHVLKPLREGTLRSAAVEAEKLQTMFGRTKLLSPQLSHPFAHLVLPVWKTVIEKSAATQSINDLALASVALERYFARHQKYPTTLSELTPEFLPAPPQDGLDGSPLYYRQTEDGRCIIWAVGFDGVDDGGESTPDDSSGKLRSYQRRLDYKGDWVWRYSLVKP
ncbi:MAG: hypothetical protein K1X78_14395 [Verrucomicrobiaceae bacterium]|nr:hypothetical protein [Verrucomicrobiaceae bacterium]